MAEFVDPGAPETPVETRVYGDEEATYKWWLETYGREEADRRAEAAGIAAEQREQWAKAAG